MKRATTLKNRHWYFLSALALFLLIGYQPVQSQKIIPAGGSGSGSSASSSAPHGASMPGVLTFVWDDDIKEMEPGGASFSDVMHSHGLKSGFTVEPQSFIENDTVNTVMSIYDLRALQLRGNSMGTAGYDEINAMYAGNTSLLAQGYTQAQLDTFVNNITRGVDAQIQYGLGRPRWHSYSNASGCYVTKAALSENGIDYGVIVFGTTPTGSASFGAGQGQGLRQEGAVEYKSARWGMWGSGGAEGGNIAAARGAIGDPYEIMQCTAETSTWVQWKAALDKAAILGGLVVFNGHRASTIVANLGAPFTTGTNLQKWTQFCDSLKVHYLDRGLLVSLNPDDAFDYYWKRPLGPLTNLMPGRNNFEDLDGAGGKDMWGEGIGAWAAGDTAQLIKVGNNSSGHNGKRSYSLNWAAGGTGTNIISTTTANDPWESSRAWVAVLAPQGSGWMARFECWVKTDTTQGTDQSASGDTIGVNIFAMYERTPGRPPTTGGNSFTVGIDNRLIGGTQFESARFTSAWYGLTTTPPNIGNGAMRLGSKNDINAVAPQEWGYLSQTFEVPDGAQYLLFNLWKCGQLTANSVIISDINVTAFRRNVVP